MSGAHARRPVDEIAERFDLDADELAAVVVSLEERGLLGAVAALEEASTAAMAAAHGLRLADLRTALERVAVLGTPPLAFTTSERDVMSRVGIDAGDHADLVAPRLAAEFDQLQLEANSLPVAAAASILGCSESRVRQRVLDPPSLLGFRRRGGRRNLLLPRFQFDLGLDRMDDWARFLRTLPPIRELAPAPLVAWLTAPTDRYEGRSRAEQVRHGLTDHLLAEAASYGVTV